ncbi:acyl-CoA dehydrogenase family protein [Nonomuraea sp. NPDC050310]|uniref:acyl-CoA dehydrogenase family protein n=1 Tax=Nonomuraea sp. NPDC050310 TaxID=3154935 RepID=UPI0033D9F12C
MSDPELRAAVRSYLAARPAAGWAAFAADLGVGGLTVPEEYGGAGRPDLAEVAVVAAELGRVLSPLPFLQSAVLAVEALRAAGSDHRLGELAEGSVSATVVFPGPLRLSGGRLYGVARHVLEGEVVLAYAGGALVEAVPSRREPYRTMDASRPLGELVFDGVPARVLGDGGGWERVRDLGIVALAAEQAGGAARCLEAATAYAKVREQFGRPIGAFQAIKHKLAEVHMAVETAQAAVEAAARGELPAAAAGSVCGTAYLLAAGENIQVHGGIGVTWEHEAHRYFKRATADACLLGSPREHRARLAGTLF